MRCWGAGLSHSAFFHVLPQVIWCGKGDLCFLKNICIHIYLPTDLLTFTAACSYRMQNIWFSKFKLKPLPQIVLVQSSLVHICPHVLYPLLLKDKPKWILVHILIIWDINITLLNQCGVSSFFSWLMDVTYWYHFQQCLIVVRTLFSWIFVW